MDDPHLIMDFIVFILFVIGTIYFAVSTVSGIKLMALAREIFPIVVVVFLLMLFCAYGAFHYFPFTLTPK